MTVALAVEIAGLKKSYAVERTFWKRRAMCQALDDINLHINQGEILGIVGRNGYGKTTLIRCIAGLMAPSVGRIHVYGLDALAAGQATQRLIGWVGAEERSFYLRLTARQNLLFFARLQGITDEQVKARLGSLAQRFGCEDSLDRRVHELSTGLRQRFAIIRALLHAPLLLILDEPTRSLDPFAADELRKFLTEWVRQDNRRSVVVTSHLLFEIEAMSHRVAIMKKGRIGACGTLQQLRQLLGAGQQVELLVQGGTAGGALDWGAEVFEQLQVTASGSNTMFRFFRQPDDDGLERFLLKLQHAGERVLSVNTIEISLQDMIERLEDKLLNLPTVERPVSLT